jgi:hypothetical protein
MNTYSIVVSILGVTLMLCTLMVLSATKRRRERRLAERVEWGAIKSRTASGEQDAFGREREAALQRVGEQFTVTRRLVIPIVLLATIALAALPFLDKIPAAALSFVVGGLTLVFGIAARPVIENAVAGLMISFSRTINLGDTVRLSGRYGTIEDISATHTTIKIWNWNRHVVPNSRMLAMEFENLSLADDLIWTHVEFVVGYDADLTEVEAAAHHTAMASSCSDSSKSSSFWYSELRPEGVVCWIAGWAKSPNDAWQLQHEIRRGLVTEFQARQIPVHSHRLQVEGLGMAGLRPAA